MKLFSNISEKNRITLNLLGVQGFFGVMLALGIYGVVYLQNIGFTTSQIGNINAFSSLMSIFACMFFGMISDKLNSVKKTVVFTLLGYGALYTLTPVLPINHSYIFIMFFVYYSFTNIFKIPSIQLVDNLTVRNCATKGANYGIIRGFGSLTFGAGSLLAVQIIDKFGLNASFVGFALIGIALILMLLFANDPKVESFEKKEKQKVSLKPLLTNYYYITFLVFGGLVAIATSADMSFLPYMMDAKGVSTDNLGTYLSIRSFTEMSLLFIIVILRKKFKLPHLSIVGVSFISLQFILIGIWANDLTTLLICSSIFGIGQGVFVGTVPFYLFKLADEHLKASAQTLYGSVIAVSGILGNFLGGYIFEFLGANLCYIFLGIVVAAALVFFAISLNVRKKLPNPAV